MEEEVEVTCPRCWETITLLLDLSEGSQSCVEDCSVCCAPMLVRFEVDDDGALARVTVDAE